MIYMGKGIINKLKIKIKYVTVLFLDYQGD